MRLRSRVKQIIVKPKVDEKLEKQGGNSQIELGPITNVLSSLEKSAIAEANNDAKNYRAPSFSVLSSSDEYQTYYYSAYHNHPIVVAESEKAKKDAINDLRNGEGRRDVSSTNNIYQREYDFWYRYFSRDYGAVNDNVLQTPSLSNGINEALKLNLSSLSNATENVGDIESLYPYFKYLYPYVEYAENAEFLGTAMFLHEVWETLGLNHRTLTGDIIRKFGANENQQELSVIIAELFGCTPEQANGMLEICTKPYGTMLNMLENNSNSTAMNMIRAYRRLLIKEELGIEIDMPKLDGKQK